MVRKNPLPAGRYWIYVNKASQSIDIFELWLKKNADIVTVERKDTYGDLWPFISPNEIFYIFVLKEPTIWPRGVGFPNEADASVKTPDDTKIRGPVPTAADVLRDIEETAAEAGKKVMSAAFDWTALVAIGAIIYFASRSRR